MSTTDQGEVLVARMEEGAFVFRAGAFHILASAADLPRTPVTALARTPNGDIYLATRDAGLYRLGGSKSASIRKGLPDLKVNCLLAAGDRDLWVGTDDGIVRWNGKEFAPAGIPGSISHFQALALARDRDGNVWAGTDSRGLLRLNSRGLSSLALDDGTTPRAVTALFEDREGGLWIGHTNGIERLRDSEFVTFSNSEGLPTDGSNPVFVDAANRMWFPPVTGGLWWVTDEHHIPVNNDGPESGCRLLHRRRQRRSMGWQATRRTHAAALRARFDCGPHVDRGQWPCPG